MLQRLRSLTAAPEVSVSLEQIVMYSVKHLNGDLYQPAAPTLAMTQKFYQAWMSIAEWNPTVVTDRLVCQSSGDEAYDKANSELLAVAVGIIFAEKVFRIPYVAWAKTKKNDYFDFRGVHPRSGRVVYLECRGRYEANHLSMAIQECRTKLGNLAAGTYHNALAVIFCPRSIVHPRAADVYLYDPADKVLESNRFEAERNVLRHYAEFIQKQNLKYGDRLAQLAEGSDDEIETYLTHGDPTLKKLEAPLTAWRTGFRYRNIEFKGTAWEGYPWPVQSPIDHEEQATRLKEASASVGGGFYWAIWRDVLTALSK